MIETKKFVRAFIHSVITGAVVIDTSNVNVMQGRSATRLRELVDGNRDSAVNKNDTMTESEVKEIFDLLVKGRVYGWIKGLAVEPDA